MDPKERALREAVAEAKAIKARYEGKTMTPEVLANFKGRVERISALRDELDVAKDIKRQLDGTGPMDDTSSIEPDLFGAKLSDALGLKFRREDIQGLSKAVESKGNYRIKAVQSEANIGGLPAGAALDFQLAPAVRNTFRIASLIPTRVLMNTDTDAGNNVTYFRPLQLATGATSVAEAAALPQSSPRWEAVDEPFAKVAHYAHVPDEAIQDWGRFYSVLGDEMMSGLIYRENAQILLGDGSSPNLAGIYDDSRSVNTLTQGTDTVLDAILRAISKVREYGFVEPDAIIMSAATWFGIRTQKDANDRYILGEAAGAGQKTVDGVPVYTSEVSTASHVFVGQFGSLRAWVRKPPYVETTNSADDDFTKDLSKVRVTERFALAVPSGSKFTDLTLN